MAITPLISIIIPVYNEQQTITKVINQVIASLRQLSISKYELVIVNDGSTDQTPARITTFTSKKIRFFSYSQNKGKGFAVRYGLSHSRGQIIIIQDADLEYHPRYYSRLLTPILTSQAQVVYGSRLGHIPFTLKTIFSIKLPLHFVANKILSWLTSVLYGQTITDMETGYKVFTRKALKNIHLKANRFDIEVEITAKILKQQIPILEIPIQTTPRDYTQGKKITFIDGVVAVYQLFKLRLDTYLWSAFMVTLLAAILRFWDLPNRYGLWSDQARDVFVARIANLTATPPLIGSFSSAGPFTFGPIWYYYAMIAEAFPGGHLNYWIGMGILSTLMTTGIIWICRRLFNRPISLAAGLLLATSQAAIDSSLGSTQHSLVPILITGSVIAMIKFFDHHRTLWMILAGLSFSLALNAHYQVLYLIPFFALFLFFARPSPTQFVTTCLIGFLPWLPMLLFDFRHEWWNLTKLLDYYRFGQYRIYVPNRWLIYAGVFWPEFWSRVVGGWPQVALITGLFAGFIFIHQAFYRKLSRPLLIITLGFFLAFVWFRYFRAERTPGYVTFAIPFITITCGWILHWLYHRSRPFTISVFCFLLFGNYYRLVDSGNHRNLHSQLTQAVITLAQTRPALKYTIYDQNFATTGCSIPLSLLLDDLDQSDGDGLPIGVCHPLSCPQNHPALFTIHRDDTHCQLVDLQSLTDQELVKLNWILLSPQEIHRMTVDWWRREPSLQ